MGREKESEEVFDKLLRIVYNGYEIPDGKSHCLLRYPPDQGGWQKRIIAVGIIILNQALIPLKVCKCIHRNIAENGLKEVPVETYYLIFTENQSLIHSSEENIIRDRKVLLVIDRFEEFSDIDFRCGSFGTETGEFVETCQRCQHSIQEYS